MKKERINTTIDLILLIFFTLSSIYSLMEAYILGSFPISLLIICAIVLLIAIAGYFTLILYVQRFRFIRRLILLIITGSLFAFSLYSSISRHSSNLVDTSGYTSYELYLLSEEDQYDELNDFNHQKIGFLFQDEKHRKVFEDVIDKNKLEIELIEYMNHNDLLEDIKNEKIQGCMISSPNLEMFQNHNDNLKIIGNYKYKTELKLPPVEKNLVKDPFTIFISGSDSLLDIHSVGHSDLNLLVMINPLSYEVEIISLPEYLYVVNQEFNYYPDILMNTSNDGIDNALHSLSATLGFEIDYYMRVNFDAFIQIIDQLGEIDVEVPQSFCEQDEKGNQGTVCIEEGVQSLDGRETLALVRHKFENVDRLEMQQKVVIQMIKKFFTSKNFTMMNEIVNTSFSSLSTNLDISQINSLLAQIVTHIDNWKFSISTLNLGKKDQVPCVSLDQKQLVEAYIMSEDDLAFIYEKYLFMMSNQRMDQFTFDLNEIQKGRVYPSSHQKLATTKNYKRKIVQYFALEPYSTVYPIQLEEWERESQVQTPVFDPTAPIQPLS